MVAFVRTKCSCFLANGKTVKRKIHGEWITFFRDKASGEEYRYFKSLEHVTGTKGDTSGRWFPV